MTCLAFELLKICSPNSSTYNYFFSCNSLIVSDTDEPVLISAAMEEKSEEATQSTTLPSGRDGFLLENFLKLLKCPVCWERSDPDNLIQCQNGHYGCRSCYGRLRTCPLCRIILQPEIQTFAQGTAELIRKELRHVENFSAQLNPESIVKIFKCTKCKLTSTTTSVFLCPKGHIRCYRCPIRGLFCWECAKLSNYKTSTELYTIRCLAVEEILSSIPKPCRYTNHGCSAIIEGFTKHETNCEYSENSCIMPLCGERVSLPKLLSHILEDCKFRNIVLDTDDTSKFNDTCYGKVLIPSVSMGESWEYSHVTILKLGVDRYFLFSCVPQMMDSTVRFYTYFIGVPEEAKNYHFTMKLKLNKDSPSIERKAPVVSACTSKYHLNEDQVVVTLSFEEIRETFSIKSQNVYFLFKVRVFEND